LGVSVTFGQTPNKVAFAGHDAQDSTRMHERGFVKNSSSLRSMDVCAQIATSGCSVEAVVAEDIVATAGAVIATSPSSSSSRDLAALLALDEVLIFLLVVFLSATHVAPERHLRFFKGEVISAWVPVAVPFVLLLSTKAKRFSKEYSKHVNQPNDGLMRCIVRAITLGHVCSIEHGDPQVSASFGSLSCSGSLCGNRLWVRALVCQNCPGLELEPHNGVHWLCSAAEPI
jgi:hypothetical protein